VEAAKVVTAEVGTAEVGTTTLGREAGASARENAPTLFLRTGIMTSGSRKNGEAEKNAIPMAPDDVLDERVR
jgi:hypothetical protein